jgi:Zn-dependent peptidase ImmA (M78 family)
MEIEEAGRNDPVRLAEAIHRQLGSSSGPVPVREIALALDIVEIREESLSSFEGALVTSHERSEGSILVNRSSNRQRRRYSIGHELLHFLNPLHEQTTANGFECSRADMALSGRLDGGGLRRHDRQEVEANRFAIELLAPVTRMRSFLGGFADLSHVLKAAVELDVSKAAIARRYVELHPASTAVVFSQNGTISYPEWGPQFPLLAIKKGDQLPGRLATVQADMLSMMDDADPEAWLKYPGGKKLYAQTLQQAGGHAMTLLLVEDDDEE